MARFDLTRYKTTHNSYSGGDRGSLVTQLDGKIRYLEFDVHDSGYEDVGDYRLGHLKPGQEVELGSGAPGANPSTILLRDWCSVLARWSDANPGHAPVTLALDLKGDLTDNRVGDLEDLNGTLIGMFGQKLFTREQFDATGMWPELDAMRNRIICVLSGNGATRASYRWAFGATPAISVNDAGEVVLVYQSSAGDLNCWSGLMDAGTVTVNWQRKSTYASADVSLFEPAVALNDDHWIVAVHWFFDSPADPRLESMVGRLGEDGRMEWFDAEVFARGTNPSLEIDGDTVREIHTRAGGGGRQQVNGTLNRRKRKVEWQSARATTANPFPRDTATWQTHQVQGAAAVDGLITSRVDAGLPLPVRFRQIAFVELQSDDELPLLRDARFFGAGAKNKGEIANARNQGLVARAWGFNEEVDKTGPPTPPQENMPATDHPTVPWYIAYMTGPEVAD